MRILFLGKQGQDELFINIIRSNVTLLALYFFANRLLQRHDISKNSLPDSIVKQLVGSNNLELVGKFFIR